jgi:hypothetical protein
MKVFKTKLFSRRAREMCLDDNAVKTGDLIEVYDE